MINNIRYYLTHDCPNCGDSDSEWAWKGARMGSSTWGHDFSCCSDKCGKEFALRHAELVRTKKGRKELAKLWQKFQNQAEHRLCGEPYYGYNAEQTLKHRNF